MENSHVRQAVSWSPFESWEEPGELCEVSEFKLGLSEEGEVEVGGGVALGRGKVEAIR